MVVLMKWNSIQLCVCPYGHCDSNILYPGDKIHYSYSPVSIPSSDKIHKNMGLSCHAVIKGLCTDPNIVRPTIMIIEYNVLGSQDAPLNGKDLWHLKIIMTVV